MKNLQELSPGVNTMPLTSDLSARMKRDHGFHRAAQLLADSVRTRHGLPLSKLAQLPQAERDYYKATSRQLIEVFEVITTGKEPDAQIAERATDAAVLSQRLAAALESRLSQERTRARLAAAERGHELGPWGPNGAPQVDGEERAVCVRCSRVAYLSLGGESVRFGLALSEGCLTVADGGGR